MIKKIISYLKEPDMLYTKIVIFIKMQFRFTKSDKEYWEKIKGKYKGKRGFVICNGPSLSMTDLDYLENEITISSNKIYLAFEKTKWRPTFFTVADPLVWEKIRADINNHLDIVHLSNYLGGNTNARIIYWRILIKKRGVECFSDDMSLGSYGGSTVTFNNLQLAVHLGLNPIYLIGCDHHYPGEKNVKSMKPIIQGIGKTHFVENYRKPGELVLPAPINKMEIAFKEARKYSDRTGVKILNASRGGKLEIFERIIFEQIFQENIMQNKDI